MLKILHGTIDANEEVPRPIPIQCSISKNKHRPISTDAIRGNTLP